MNNLKSKTVTSGDKVKQSGFYEPINHDSCIILEAEQRRFLASGSPAPSLLGCNHDVVWMNVLLR